MVLSRPCHPDDQFTTSILRHWCMKHDELLAEHIKSLLIKNNSLPRKRQRWDPPAWPTGRPQGGPVWSLPGLWATPSGVKQPGVQDRCGPFTSFSCAPSLVPVLSTPPLPCPAPPRPILPVSVGAASVLRRNPCKGGAPCSWSLHPKLRLTLLTSLQPEEFQQQAGPADSGADLRALGQSASQPDQHQAELYAPQPWPRTPTCGSGWGSSQTAHRSSLLSLSL